MSITWAQRAADVIYASLRASAGKPAIERVAAVDAAYPFGERAHHPYKQWLQVRRQILFQNGLLNCVMTDRRQLVELDALMLPPGTPVIGAKS